MNDGLVRVVGGARRGTLAMVGASGTGVWSPGAGAHVARMSINPRKRVGILLPSLPKDSYRRNAIESPRHLITFAKNHAEISSLYFRVIPLDSGFTDPEWMQVLVSGCSAEPTARAAFE